MDTKPIGPRWTNEFVGPNYTDPALYYSYTIHSHKQTNLTFFNPLLDSSSSSLLLLLSNFQIFALKFSNFQSFLSLSI